MLDRFALLNGLLKSVIPSKKLASVDDDDFDVPKFIPKSQVATPIPPATISQPTPTEEDDFDIPVYQTKPKAIPVPIAPPLQPIVQSIEPAPIPIATPAIQKEPVKRELPSWFDPEWKPIKKFKVPNRPSTSDWLKLEDEEEKSEPEPKPEIKPESKAIIEPVVIQPVQPVEKTISFREAKEYLESLPSKPLLEEAITALDLAFEEIRDHSKNQSLMSKVFALVISHFVNLITNADVIFVDNKEKGIAAANAIKDEFYSKIGKLPKKFQEKSSREIAKATEGRKANPLVELHSQWYGPEMIFVNNRAIRLMKHGSTAEGTILFDEAQRTAREEWLALEQLVTGLVPSFSEEDKMKLQELGAKEMVAGSSFEDAKKRIVQYLEAIEEGSLSIDNIGVDNEDLEKLFPDVKIDLSEDWQEEAETISDNDMVRNQLRNLPQNVIDDLAPKIVKLGKLSLRFSKVTNAHSVEDLLEAFGMGHNETITKDEAKDKLQSLYELIESLIQQVFIINPEYINEKLAHQLFKEVYFVSGNLRAEALEEDLSTITPQSAAEAGLHSDTASPTVKNLDPKFKRNPRLQRPNETETEYKARQKHEKELADNYRYNYTQRILLHGDPSGYMKNRKLYHSQRRKGEDKSQYDMRKEKEAKIHELDKPEYKYNINESAKWRSLASRSSVRHSEIDDLINSQKERTLELVNKISNSKLPQNTLALIEKRLLRRRIEHFQKEYYEIRNVRGMNRTVIKAMENMINDIPSYFAEAKETLRNERVSSAKVSLDMAMAYQKFVVS